mgnify:FL=1|tara:strand:+ start:1095 stop:1352 length:258 start_codon:yes stop_codon:yes gene_type:complete
MKSKNRIVVSSVSHDDVKLAMERFLKHGGKITKVKDSTQEILLKQDMGEEDMDFIDPHAANSSRNGLGEAGNVLQQELQNFQEEV